MQSYSKYLCHSEQKKNKVCHRNIFWKYKLLCVSKNDSDVAHYNFNAHQPISVIFGGDIAERICY